MKIKDRYEIIDVFAIYWMGDKTYFYGLSKGYDGLLAYSASEVEIVEPTLAGDFIYLENGIFYKPLIEENILDDLVEANPDAYHKFLNILKNKNLLE